MQEQVAIYGIKGSYHQIASQGYFDQEPIITECRSFREVLAFVRQTPRSFGVMAIENTVAGTLLQNLELLRNSGLRVVGEQKLRITHSLAAIPGTTLSEVQEICSHQMALLQCQAFLDTIPTVRTIEVNDTATAAKHVAAFQQKQIAAICSQQAATINGLEILAEGIETDKRNFTRFLIVTQKDNAEKNAGPVNKVSLVFSLPHTPGSLSRVLSVFADFGLNLTKIQSYPRIGAEWEYSFYVDLTFSNDELYWQAIQTITPLTAELQILGEYTEAN